MLDRFLILAEGGAHASEGVSPFLVGGAAFAILMCLLGITYLFKGLNQVENRPSRDVVRAGEADAGTHGAHGSQRSH